MQDPSKFAAAVAAVSADAGAPAAAAKGEEKKEVVAEESDEEDYGGFGLFDDEQIKDSYDFEAQLRSGSSDYYTCLFSFKESLLDTFCIL